MNPLAEQLNTNLSNGNPNALDLLSSVGKQLFFPKGILSQSAEAKEKAHAINATIGIAREEGDIMCFPSVMEGLAYRPDESLTYAPSFGIPELRKAWQASLFEKNPSLAEKTISLPVVTCGITHAISVFAEMWCNAGDTVILPDMMWGNYNLIMNVRLGIQLRHYPIFTPEGGFNVEGLMEQVRDEADRTGKAIVLLNFPQNPTGYAISQKEASELIAGLKTVAESGSRLLVATDDAYFGLFYEEETLKESLFALFANLHENILALKLDGATKENYVWGLRVGFMTYGTKISGDPAPFYEALERKTAGCIRGNISNASHLGQRIVLKSMQDTRNKKEHAQKYEVLKARAARVKDVLKDPRYTGAFTPYPFNAGYFMCVRLKDLEAEPLRLHLLETYGVGLIALGKYDIRVAFSCIEEDEVKPLFDTLLQGILDLKDSN
ncbi:aminotransferase class I/II-fold pyridoxal phosphate-dependent enzyme [Desulfobotulus sp. H1]|uniref:Aminotransferase class I/II-fold pyridoxal phosphate-dependent enzyme n=1 Tax=Desulfobotulus pelophilus TaxID=2823377 RepID=A0ABT3N532_9BACT|nr:aminotransferase class I/II-fold pyridoxal phosphate-dependent enzyme [Desulfobotulus pelophilus]MCW7752568.1 aminotransferase class I/II-fold pyridoxal phosphate-dependent enzyme [Desulfobotulus pelophilus]